MTGLATGDAMKRIVATGLISLIGLVLFVPNAVRLASLRGPAPGAVLAGVGALLAAVLVGVGYLLARSDLTAMHTLRVAGWAALGTVLLGLVLALIALSGVDLPLFAAATLLSVSTFAHVVIGVRDVQRIRAEDLARQREKLAVLNRLVRHNLRHEAQRLLGVVSRLSDADGDDRTSLVSDVRGVAESLTDMNDVLGRSQPLIGREIDRSVSVDLAAVIEDVVAEYRESHPDATIEVDVPSECHIGGGGELRAAIAELVENALIHAEDAPRVEIEASATRGRVTLGVTDNGPGLPEAERAVVTREADIDELTHSEGLGLWFVRWVVDAYGGELRLDSDEAGTTVTLELPRAGG